MSNTYSKEERLEALKLADEIGPVGTAQRLNINLNTLYNRQSKARKQGITAEHPTPKMDMILLFWLFVNSWGKEKS